MIQLFLCLTAAIILASGSPTREIQCPYLPCPLPPCDNPHPTYYEYHGKLCQGCSQCDDPQTVTCPFLPCPSLPCADNETYPTNYNYHGTRCQGCSQCLSTQAQGGQPKRQLTHFQCPMVRCAYPGPCPVSLVQSTFHINGQDCPGCPVCPTTTTAAPVA